MRVFKFMPAVLFAILPVFNAFAVEGTVAMCPITAGNADLKVGVNYTTDATCYNTGDITSACFDCSTSTLTRGGGHYDHLSRGSTIS